MTSIIEGASLLRRQIVELLDGDATLKQRVSRVFGYIPPNDTAQPFLVAYPMRVVDQSALGEGEDGVEVSLSISAVWGHYEGEGDAHPLVEIFAQVHELLQGFAVTIPGFDATQLTFLELDEEQDADGLGFDGRITFQCQLLREAD